MSISSNNMKWFSGYSLMNRLFSQKNGNQAGVSNQAGTGWKPGDAFDTRISDRLGGADFKA